MKKSKDEMQIPGKILIPCGFVCKPGMVIGMFWRIGAKIIFWCDKCSKEQLKNMEPPLISIDEDWEPIRKELFDMGHSVAVYYPKTLVRCDKCGLTIPGELPKA
jgi:hypothetical protein